MIDAFKIIILDMFNSKITNSFDYKDLKKDLELIEDDFFIDLYNIYINKKKLFVEYKKIQNLTQKTKKNWIKKYKNENFSEWLLNGFLFEFKYFSTLTKTSRIKAIKKDFYYIVKDYESNIGYELEVIKKSPIESEEISDSVILNKPKEKVDDEIYQTHSIINNIPVNINRRGINFKVTSENETEYISSPSSRRIFKVNKNDAIREKNKLTINNIYLLNEYNSDLTLNDIELSVNSKQGVLDGKLLKETLSLISSKDKMTLNVILQNLDLYSENFIYKGEITLPLRETCETLNELGIIKKYDYNSLKNTMMKFQKITCEKESVFFHVIDYYSHSLENNSITIRLGTVFRDEIMKSITIKTYKEVFKKLNVNSPTPQILLVLQELRIRLEIEIRKAIKEGCNFVFDRSILSEKVFNNYLEKNYLEIELHFRYFEKCFIYNNRKSDFIKMLNSSLNEITGNNILIQEFDFIDKKENFRIRFKNLNKESIEIIEKEKNPFPHLICS